ncbi:MAG: helix-turn-helix domain-containing protein [Burkholderia sp.]|nr:helix-turn-helix domain-containing protein [Burkholderia sp.]
MNKLQRIKDIGADTEKLQIEEIESLSVAGNQLSKLREACGFSINDVSARLKVPSSKLLALEAGDIRQFPGLPFTIGVIRSYTRMLGVDSDPFVQVLRFEGIESKDIDASIPAQTGINMKRENLVKFPRASSYRFRLWSRTVAVITLLIATVIWTSNKKSTSREVAVKKTSDMLNALSANSIISTNTVSVALPVIYNNKL